MATQEEIKAIAGLYVAYFDRAPDPAGLDFWIRQLDNGRDFTTISQDFATSLEAQDIYPFLANPELATTSPAAFVTSIYANLFGRAPEQAGLDFWVNVINSGDVLPGDMVEAVMLGARNAVINGEFVQDKTTIENKIECALEFTNSVSAIEGYTFDGAAYDAARQAVDGIDATPESVAEAKIFIEGYVGSFLPVDVFTACPNEVLISPAVVGELVTETVIYWGYNPHGHGETGVDNLDGNDPNGNDNNLTNEGPADGGISAEAFFFGTNNNPSYLSVIAGTDFQEMAEFDLDVEDFPVPDFSNLRDITVTSGDAGTGGVVTFHYSDGSSDDIAIGTEYFDFLHDLIFDEEGNTRFFEKEVAAQIPVYLDEDGVPTTDPSEAVGNPIGSVDAFIGAEDAVYAHLPMVLTTIENNGGTKERGFTTDENDLIQVGQLQLLHGAIIDGGGGYNTIEVDAKGHFAQPKALQNIQQITVTNLPNVYTPDEDGSEDGDGSQGSTYPYFADNGGYEESILDVTRATELENLTIVEGDYDYVDADISEPDTLVVTGLRKDATLTLQGSFYEDVYVRTGEGNATNGFTVILQNVQADNSMYITDNSAQLNLVSEGGGNVIGDLAYYNTDMVTDLVITGEAHLFIESDLGDFMVEDTPVTIDASGNEGGVDLNISDVEQVTFLGSTMDDRFAVDTSNSTSTSQGPDFDNDESVVINNALGDNYYDIDTYALELNDGDGDGNVEINIIQGTITLGDGDNHVEGNAVNLVATAGDGDNKFDILGYDSPQQGVLFTEDDFPTLIDLTAGDGSNIFNVFVVDETLGSGGNGHYLAAAEVNITAGDGGNLIQIPALPYDLSGYIGGNQPSGTLNDLLGGDNDTLSTVTINVGDGDDTIVVGGSTININSGGGDDTITLMGIDNDYVTEVFSSLGTDGNQGSDYGYYALDTPEDGAYNFKGFTPSIFGAELNVDTGSGSATINLGAYQDNAGLVSGAIVAKEGSVITGSDITLFVNTHADLRAADLSGITAVIMDDDKYTHGGQGFPAGSTSVSESASLTLLDTQFLDLGQDVFSTQGETFGAQSTLTLVITSDTTLSQLIDFSSWNDSVKLCFVIEDGATLTLSAEELHEYVAPEGIAVDEINGYIDNQVVITDAGFFFDAFGDQNGGTGGGTLAGSLSNQDITIIRTPDGYERPSQDPSTDTITIDSDVTPVIDYDVYSPFSNTLEITGSADLEIQGRIDLADNFTIDFTEFTGDFIPENADGVEEAFTVYNFQEISVGSDPYDWGRIDGNGTSADPVRVNVVMQDETTAGDESLGVAKGGIHTSGVQQFVFTGFVDSLGYDVPQATGGVATIVVCDKTEDLELLGLQNNRNAEITFKQVNWGTEILMEGDGYANASDQEKNLGDPDLSEVGAVNVNFFEAGANAFVRVTNQGTELGLNEDAEDGFDPDGERVLDVEGIAVSNADRLLIQVEDGDAVINDVSGLDVERVIVTGPEDVKIFINGVADDDLGSPMAMPGQGLDSDDLVSIDGSGVAGEFSLAFTDDADLSGVTLTGVDSIMLGADVCLTLTAQQVIDLGDVIMSMGTGTELAVVEYEGEGIDFSAIDVDNIKSITTSDVDGDIIVDPAADFGDADVFVILAEDSDTNVQMTAAQFGTIDGGTVEMEEGGGTDGSLSLTDVPADDEIDVSNVSADADGDGVADINLIGVDFVATEDFLITDDAGGNSADQFITAILSGTNDVTEVPVANLLDLDCLLLQDGAVLTLTAEQLEILLDNEEFKVEDGANATINITDLSDETLDLDALVDEFPGLNIGTITIADNNMAITIDPGTTFGDADEIITPTADENDPFDGLEDTSVTMTVNQFLSSGGVISGDSIINLTELANNNDSDGDFVLDEAVLDVSGISAPLGFISLLEEGATITEVGETVTLAEVTDLSGFMEILLTDGQLIRFKTEAQADGATITDAATVAGNPVGVAWLFETWSGTAIDTSNYDPNIDTLFVHENLVNGQNEEAIWTFLPGSIVVQKFNDAAPQGLVVTVRVNSFEPFGFAPDGITFDDENEFQTTGALILNLEGNVEIGDITIADTLGEGSFDFLEINSTIDMENLPTSIAPNGFDDPGGLLGGDDVPGIIVQPNRVGDIFLNAPMADGLDMLVFLSTLDDFQDAAYANGTTGAGSGPDLDEGLALETGTIFLGTPGAGINMATLVTVGDHDITIEGLDYSDPALQRVDVITVDGGEAFDFGGTNDLVIGGINWGDLSEVMNLSGAPDIINILNDFTADALTDLNFLVDGGTTDEEAILATDGDVDLTAMGDTDDVFDIDGLIALSAGTVMLTADQIEEIIIQDAFNGADGIADNFVLGPGVAPGDVTIDVYGLNTQVLDLDLIQAAGFNIGTITVIAPGADLDNGTTLGGADQIVIEINDGDGEVTLELSAEQYNQLADGTIVEDRDPDADPIADIGTVIIDNLADIEGTDGEVDIDVSNVSTTGNNTFWIGETDVFDPSPMNDNDTTFSAASVLDPADPSFSSFSVTLADLNSGGAPDELAGQTIRFSIEEQADGRVVLIVGADDDTLPASNDPDNIGIVEAEKDEKDTNVVWLFDTVSGGLDVSDYAGNLGRLWVSDELVDSVGGDVDSLFTIDDPENPGTPLFTLDADIIKRIETADLDALLQLNIGIAQRVEVTAFTQIAGAEFEIDDPLVSIETLRIDMGGATDINNLEIDNILGPVDPVNTNFPGDDDFEELVINSLLANNPDHYLLPDEWTTANPLPSNDQYNDSFENNVVGDISSGEDRGVLHTIRINTFEDDTIDTIPPAADETDADFTGTNVYNGSETLGREGAQFVAETIYFSDDGDTTAVGGDIGTEDATLTITGENDVTVKSLDTSDAEITSLTVDLMAYAGTFTVTGGSPAFDGDDATNDTTTSFTVVGSVDSVMTLASTVTTNNDMGYDPEDDFVTYNVGDGETVPYAGVSSGALEEIDVTGMAGTISLGVISQVNSEEFTLLADGAGQVFGCIGRGLDDGVEEVPELSATGVWTVDGGGAGDDDFPGANNVDLEIKEVIFNNGGQLNLDSVDLCITGDIDMSVLDVADITITGGTTIEVKEGGKLTLSIEQATVLEDAGINIFGAGTVCIVGESDDSEVGTQDATFGNLLTATVDLSQVTLADDDTSDAVEITVSGAHADAAGTVDLEDENGDRVAQTIIGTAANDTARIAIAPISANDGDPTTLDVILELGADTGDIADPLLTNETVFGGDPSFDDEDVDEEVGDVVIKETSANTLVNVTGFDQVAGGGSEDTYVVAADGNLHALFSGDFVATEDDINDGVAVLEQAEFGGDLIDVSDAGGANGWNLLGRDENSTSAGAPYTDTLIGSDQSDVLIDGAADAALMGDNAGVEDSFTGNDSADEFIFNVATSETADFDIQTVVEATDRAEITVDAAFAANAIVRFTFEIGSQTFNITLQDDVDGVDLMTTDGVADALADALDGLNGVSAGATGSVVEVENNTDGNSVAPSDSDNGARFNFTAAVEDPNGTPDPTVFGTNFTIDELEDASFDSDPDAGDDDRLELTIELSGDVIAGEIYSIQITPDTGSPSTITVAAPSTDLQDLADAIAENISAAFGALADVMASSNGSGPGTFGDGDTVPAAGANELQTATTNAGIPANTIVLWSDVAGADVVAFEITSIGSTPIVAALSSSSLLETGDALADADMDTITDFMSGEDSITFGLGSGVGAYSEADGFATFNDAFEGVGGANDAMAGGDTYFFAETAEGSFLFYDANGDGVADGAVIVEGVGLAGFDDSDIV